MELDTQAKGSQLIFQAITHAPLCLFKGKLSNKIQKSRHRLDGLCSSSNGSIFLAVSSDLEFTLRNLLFELLQSAALVELTPGGKAAVEHFVHFLKRVTLCLGGHEEHVDEGCGVEGGKL